MCKLQSNIQRSLIANLQLQYSRIILSGLQTNNSEHGEYECDADKQLNTPNTQKEYFYRKVSNTNNCHNLEVEAPVL